jgi:hypothetical protein
MRNPQKTQKWRRSLHKLQPETKQLLNNYQKMYKDSNNILSITNITKNNYYENKTIKLFSELMLCFQEKIKMLDRIDKTKTNQGK